jgi:hypothetical protein
MEGLVVLALIVLIIALSYFGVESRRLDDHGWVGAPRSKRED